MLYAWKLTFHVFVEGSKISVVYQYWNFSQVHTLCAWLLRQARIHGLIEMLVDTLGTPGRFYREKFRIHLWSYFTNTQNERLIDRCPDQECTQYWFFIQVWWSLSDVNASVLSHPAMPVEKITILFLTPAAHHCRLLKVIIPQLCRMNCQGSLSPFQSKWSGLAKTYCFNRLS